MSQGKGIFIESPSGREWRDGQIARLTVDVPDVGLSAGWICRVSRLVDGWVLESAEGDVVVGECLEILDLLEVDGRPAPLKCAPAKLGGVGKLVTDMYKDSGMSE